MQVFVLYTTPLRTLYTAWFVTIQYILSKDNDIANALNKRNDYIKTKKSFNYNILKINKNESLLTNKYELNAIL